MDSRLTSRRNALKKLGLGIFAAYSAPEMIFVSGAAQASTPQENPAQQGSSASAPTTPSNPTMPSLPDASLPSGPEPVSNWRADDTCTVRAPTGNQITISNSDFRNAQRAVQSGEVAPLNEVIREVQKRVNGRLIDVQFDNSRNPPIYRFRMVSNTGKLVTVTANAQSTQIIRIIDC